MNLLQSSFHMLPVTWTCDDVLVQLVVGGELLTPAANQTACRLEEEEKERCERVMVIEEVGVSGGVIRADTVPSYHTAGCDLNPPAVHSHSLFPLAASNPNTRFVIRPSTPPPLTQSTQQSV